MQGVHVMASKLAAQRTQLNVLADNVANINTHGFKRLIYEYENVDTRKEGQHIGDYVKGAGVLIDQAQGPLEKSDNPLDMAIIGDAYFAIDANGTTEYSRNGHFNLNQQGVIVNAYGQPVLDTGGAPITIPADASRITITAEGSVATEDGVIADLGLYTFAREDVQALNRAGNGSYVAPDGINPILANNTGEAEVLQGHLEISNVKGIEEVVRLQELSRSYQQVYKSVKSMEDLQQRAIRNISTMP